MAAAKKKVKIEPVVLTEEQLLRLDLSSQVAKYLVIIM